MRAGRGVDGCYDRTTRKVSILRGKNTAPVSGNLATPYYDTPSPMADVPHHVGARALILLHGYKQILYALCYNYRNLSRSVDKGSRSSIRLLASNKLA